MSGRKSKIIAVEPDAKLLRELEVKLAVYHSVIPINQIDRVLPLLRSEHDVAAVLVSASKGVDVLGVLQTVQHEWPDVLRILLTGFEDLTLVVEGLHSGAVQRVLSRPIQYAEFLYVLRANEPSATTSPAHLA